LSWVLSGVASFQTGRGRAMQCKARVKGIKARFRQQSDGLVRFRVYQGFLPLVYTLPPDVYVCLGSILSPLCTSAEGVFVGRQLRLVMITSSSNRSFLFLSVTRVVFGVVTRRSTFTFIYLRCGRCDLSRLFAAW